MFFIHFFFFGFPLIYERLIRTLLFLFPRSAHARCIQSTKKRIFYRTIDYRRRRTPLIYRETHNIICNMMSVYVAVFIIFFFHSECPFLRAL